MASEPIVSVIPDVSGVNQPFDYAIPEMWFGDGRAQRVDVGSLVRVELHGRRVGGWVVARHNTPPPGVTLLPLRKWSSIGPDAAMIDLCEWAGARWFGHRTRLLKVASPPRNVAAIPPWTPPKGTTGAPVPDWAAELFSAPEVAVQRLAPSADRWPIVEAALAGGSPLFVVPTQATVDVLVRRIRAGGRTVAKLPDDWALARAGAPAVGTRSAVFSPQVAPSSIVVFDEHDDALTEERTPTWNAREVAIERARRLGIACVLVSPTPSLRAATVAAVRTRPRNEEFEGWPQVVVLDRRLDPPGSRGLLSPGLTAVVRGEGRVACIVNRLGRAQLLICATCDEITSCEACDAAVYQPSDASELRCRRCGAVRPVICQSCGATKLKNRRVGVSRAREELEALVGEPVGEISGETEINPDARVVVGTEALMYALGPGSDVATVALLDYDQELMALRQRAGQQALALAARAARIVGRRSGAGRLVVQTRRPDDPVVVSLVRGDPTVAHQAMQDRARDMGWPPFRAQAAVSGAGAATFVSSLGGVLGIDVYGPNDDKWLVRADTHEQLLSELRKVPRPAERLRIDIDPIGA